MKPTRAALPSTRGNRRDKKPIVYNPRRARREWVTIRRLGAKAQRMRMPGKGASKSPAS
ncbi:hypothetical protein PproGo58_26150 [Pseudomonas protegens]|nr:hypothetical protein PproGo58_26150 [Pseudomonas protegens]